MARKISSRESLLGVLDEEIIATIGFGPEMDAVVAESLNVAVDWYGCSFGKAEERIPYIRALRARNDHAKELGIAAQVVDDGVPSFSEDLYAVTLACPLDWEWEIERSSSSDGLVARLRVVEDDREVIISAEATSSEGLDCRERTEALARSRAVAMWGIASGRPFSEQTVEFAVEAFSEF